MTGQQEERLDRRAHWVQAAITGLVIATGWCVRLEYTVSQLKSDMESQKSKRDDMISKIWDRMGQDHDMLIRHDEKLKGSGGYG